MCTTCGCGSHSALIGGKAMRREPRKQGGTVAYRPAAEAAHDHAQARIVRVERDILARNDALAADNRAFFVAHNILALNLVSSPGSGKTTLLVRTITELMRGNSPSLNKKKFPLSVRGEPVEPHALQPHTLRQAQGERPFFIAVIEGDQQTDNDAERIRATGVAAIQINTGKGCHLDAGMVGQALEQLDLPDDALLFIENVGNLVCPAAFDLGEAAKVVVLSVTEGEDKPLKYPDMFRAANLMLLNKCDLLPHLSFDIELAESHARRVNPAIKVIRLSATGGEGMNDWMAWLDAQRTTIIKRN